MIRRVLLVVFVFMFLGLVWIGSISAVTIAIFKDRNPNKCMARYYNVVSPEALHWECKDGDASPSFLETLVGE